MSCLGYKGGIGTASRVTPDGHTVGVLLMTNFGERERLTVDGVPGRPAAADRTSRRPAAGRSRPAGSCIGVVVTDAPVDGAGCARLARRIGLGLARTGSTAHHGSGEIFLAAATGLRLDRDGALDAGADGCRPGPSTRCSRPWSTPARRRCSTRCSAPRTVVGRDGNTSSRAGRPTRWSGCCARTGGCT